MFLFQPPSDEDKIMSTTKKKKKVTTKKNVVKKPVKKKVAKKPAKAKKKVAKKKTTAKKKATPKKKIVKKAKKATGVKATVKKLVDSVKKATALKKTPKKKVAKTKSVAPSKKTPKKKVTKTKIATKINKPKNEAPPPTIKEEVRVDTTTEEVAIAPYAIHKNEDYMTEDQLEHFRKILLRWKQQLMQEVDSTVVHMQEDGLSFPDPIDRAAQEEGFNLELRTRDRERKLIKKIESALDSIETGDYGYCEDCGAEIGVRRLEARPTAEKCIDCKTYEEIREKQGSAR